MRSLQAAAAQVQRRCRLASTPVPSDQPSVRMQKAHTPDWEKVREKPAHVWRLDVQISRDILGDAKRMMGFEPTTFCMASRCSSQLSYIRESGRL
jgi:hypothetical protein